ncbi:hypothetical protein [Algoriphagus yeomjeoni]|uniref:Uncharacterized protein n=1 Tax=Algoriphagus yeomjeoni TaxID=291403 RepID=A0A327PP57_9BACT|nr:hypothetical protein [Algoriphagus yeomjeoni]RAI94110.1 hypothetical protein LV83_01017 [Algoriphagus yeomjeoni]
MKKLFLYMVFTITTIVPAFSQSISSQIYDFNLDLPTFESDLEFDLAQGSSKSSEAIQFRQFKNLEDFQNTIENKNLPYRQDENLVVVNPDPVYSLRILKPTGNYPIQVYKPDSTKNYTLLIKKF